MSGGPRFLGEGPNYRQRECYRFFKQTAPKSDGCLIWIGPRATKGYGHFWPNGGPAIPAHRWVYKMFVGPIPDGLELDHLCRVRACVNPRHLEPVTGTENIRRGVAARGPKTHCKRGHEFTPENTYTYQRTGHRECVTCRNEVHYPKQLQRMGLRP